ncbi:secreted RxLR effector protein 161-like [Vitis riparia]|uniref:secreted RxLR effector protein 161-like n=2 Tax=Vitis riparia TaxID=96939 RepID=UPI00155A4017|nr:secreted RxLR effector protein 161-like [Vitis riparia]
MQKIPYASAVGSLMYAQVCTRPDIAYIVGMLGRYLSNPGMDHWRAAKRVMRYLQRTKEYMLTYRRLDQLEFIGYSDSDFAGCQDSRRSTSGYIYLLAGGAISWRSAKQTLVTSSTMEAEFVACYEASNQGIWLRNFVTGLRVLDGTTIFDLPLSSEDLVTSLWFGYPEMGSLERKNLGGNSRPTSSSFPSLTTMNSSSISIDFCF